jgi:hypothetical protein
MLNQEEQTVIQNVIIQANAEETIAVAATQQQQQQQQQQQPPTPGHAPQASPNGT